MDDMKKDAVKLRLPLIWERPYGFDA